MRTLCYSVRLQSFIRISDICYKAIDFSGNYDFIPASHYFGEDSEVKKSEAYWISSWILSKKKIQYSRKKQAYFSKNGKKLPNIEYKKHIPDKINKKDNIDESLIR